MLALLLQPTTLTRPGVLLLLLLLLLLLCICEYAAGSASAGAALLTRAYAVSSVDASC